MGLINKKLFLASLLISTIMQADEWESLLPEFEAYAEKSRQECQAVGMAIAIVKDAKVIYAKGFGNRSLQDSRPVTVDTLFQIGSMSKSFTTALTALTVDRKQLQWEDAVIDHVPSFVMHDPWVTRAFEIEDLYAQRSGLVSYEGDTQALLGVAADKMIYNLRFFPPISSFRSQFAYQNIFFSVGANVLEQVAKQSWHALVKKEFFDPLNMKSASSDLASYLKTDNRVGWHIRKPDGKVELIPDTVETANWVYLFAPAGGINATILDMAKWLILQTDLGVYQGKQIISKENLARTHRPHIFAKTIYNLDTFYCLGWLQTEYSPYPIIWHNGATSGVSNNMAIIPQDRLGLVILCNCRDTVVAEALTLKFFDLYYKKPKVDWTQVCLEQQKQEQKSKRSYPPLSNPLPSLPLEEYAGTYTNPVYGDLIITISGKDLQGVLGPKKTRWLLKHYNRDTFSLFWSSVENGENKATFYLTPQNKPEKLIIEILENENMGTFLRKEK